MRRTAADAEITRLEILSEARSSFARDGYAGTQPADVAERCGVTRGAVYHHFVSKAGLFEAVLIELSEELDAAVTAAAGKAPDTRSALEDGARACIKFMGKSEYRQIVVEDGPAVVGLQRWYEIDRSIGLGNMELALAILESEGNLAVAASDGLARALFGALTELGLAYSRSELKLEE
ncbi:MAG: TetR family transcriptional regulator, partial [Actinobacteria bacterium]|nr:TetR family transcriptional regulator [Actinomycetota bacterium]